MPGEGAIGLLSWLLPQSLPCPPKGGFSAFRGRGGRTGLDFQEREICYNVHNAPVSVTDANGIVTDYSYSDAGCVTRIVRRDGSEVLSSVGPVSSKGASYPAGRSLGVVWFSEFNHHWEIILKKEVE